MRLTEIIAESFDKPYLIKMSKGEFGDYDGIVKLTDGTNLEINFNLEDNSDNMEQYSVEFHRSGSQDLTGEGDAHRIFATVVQALGKFVSKVKPYMLTFNASKEVETGQNPESRTKLYNRLVNRYASQWGYSVYTEDHGDVTVYELVRKINEARTLAPVSPVQQLIDDYKIFATFNLARLADYAKPGKEQDLKAVVQRAIKSAKELDVLKSDNEKLRFIHDMIKYIQPHMKAHMKVEHYEKYKPRIQKLVDLYKAVV